MKTIEKTTNMNMEKDASTDCSVKFYGKSELAVLYCPLVNPQSALKNLTRWIKRNKELSRRLHEIGYDTKRRTFFSREVELIFEYLGRP